MSRRFGLICIVLGICCLLSSVGLVFYNKWDDKKAEETSKQFLEDIHNQIQENINENTKVENESLEMLTTKIGNYDCIGVLSIPVLDLELPVLTDWNYTKLKKAPCHYYGTYYEPDFVIAAHNYPSHFGKLAELQEKDLVLFTDVSGNVYYYEVVLIETLGATATNEMITSGFDLSLYTCTVGGGSRVTVRCSKI